MSNSKRYKNSLEKFDPDQYFSGREALEVVKLFEKTKLQIISSFNDEIIEGRLVNWGLIPRWFINRYRNKLGAYCHLTLIKR